MKTNQNGHALRSLTNRVMAVIDDARNTQAAVEMLERAGLQTGNSPRFRDDPLLGDVITVGLKQLGFEPWVVFGDGGPTTAAHARA